MTIMSLFQCKKKSHDSYHHGNLREAAIETALEMVANEGAENITLRELTRRLGTSRSAIYRHFDNKEALMQAVILAGFERLDGALQPIFHTKELDVKARLMKMGRAYMAFATDNPELYRLLFGEKASDAREAVCDIENPDQAVGFHALVYLLVEGQECGAFRKEDPFIQASAVWALIHGLSSLVIDGHLMISGVAEEILASCDRILFEGLERRDP